MYKNNKEFLISFVRDLSRQVAWLVQPVRFRPTESFKIIAHGRTIREFLMKKLDHADPVLIPNVYIDESDILKARLRLQNSAIRLDENGNFNIYSAGPFLSIKNFDISIEVLRLLCEKQPTVNWRLHLFGDGPLRASCEEQARRVLPDGHLVFHGWVPRSDLQRFVDEKASICLMPTFELGGAVPLEAHVFGIPVFCVKGRSISYYHERFLGEAVEADERAALPQAIVEAITNFKVTEDGRTAGLAALSMHSRRVLEKFIETLKA
jgi:glycosyltransferase involved in cell wall biosynthesis